MNNRIKIITVLVVALGVSGFAWAQETPDVDAVLKSLQSGGGHASAVANTAPTAAVAPRARNSALPASKPLSTPVARPEAGPAPDSRRNAFLAAQRAAEGYDPREVLDHADATMAETVQAVRTAFGEAAPAPRKPSRPVPMVSAAAVLPKAQPENFPAPVKSDPTVQPEPGPALDCEARVARLEARLRALEGQPKD